MIRVLDTPIECQYKLPSQRTPGRGDGLSNFAAKLVEIFGNDLRKWIVLDVGAGDGWLGEFLSCRYYLPFDPQSNSLRAMAEFLPFQNVSVDLVVSKQTLVHFRDPALACREMIRVSRHAVVVRQEFPERPIGWHGHSRVMIDGPEDIYPHLEGPGWLCSYDGTDFVSRRV